MLELVLLFLLIKGVKNNAHSRGRKPGGFIALAIILWVVPELAGLIIGLLLDLEYGSILLAYTLVGVGAIISYNISKHCKKGDFVPEQELLVRKFTENYEPLATEQQVVITREKAWSGSAVQYDMVLNGKLAGSVGNGETISAVTDQRQNILVARPSGGEDLPPFVFQVADGCNADIHFAGGKFIPERSTGIVAYGYNVDLDPALAIPRYVPVAATSAVSPVYAPQGQVQTGYIPVATQSPAGRSGANFCEYCGSPLPAGAKFCGKCGSKIEV